MNQIDALIQAAQNAIRKGEAYQASGLLSVVVGRDMLFELEDALEKLGAAAVTVAAPVGAGGE